MTDQPSGLREPSPRDRQIGAASSDETSDPGAADPGLCPCDDPEVEGRTVCGSVDEPWWQRVGIGLMGALVVLGSVVLPPGRTALAESTLGSPVQTEFGPTGIGINPITNRIYVSNQGSGTVTVIDSLTNTTVGSSIRVGDIPVAVGVNPTTNRIYVANQASKNVTVIDGASNTVIGQPIPVSGARLGVGVNPVTNRIYVTDVDGSTMAVFDGATNAPIGNPIPVGKNATGVGVNPVTNHIYAASFTDGTLTVVDGVTNAIIGNPIPVGTHPGLVAVNPVTNRIYVTNDGDNSLTVINGATNTVIGDPIGVGTEPIGVAVNPATNRIYVASFVDNKVFVIDGATNAMLGAPISVGKNPFDVQVDPTSNRVYVANVLDANVSVIGIPLDIAASAAQPGSAESVTWSSLSGANGGDFVGLYEQAVANTSPLSRRFTNGSATPGGSGVSAGSVDLPIPPGLTPGAHVEVRLVSGASGGTLARVTDAVPIAMADTFTIAAAGTLNVAAPGVLTNDTDPDGSALQSAVVAGPTHGTLALQANGALTYTPNAAFSGSDTFSYRATDQAGLGSTATVTVVVTAAPIGASDSYTVGAGSVLTVPAPGVLANDTDPDSPSLQSTLGTNPGHGTLLLQLDGSFTYTPAAGFSGTDSFTYLASDQSSVSRPVTVTITVRASTPGPGTPGGPGTGNAPPTAGNDAFTTTSGVTLNVPAPGVLANDSDPDSRSMQAVAVTGPAHGSLTLQPSGAFTYTPNADFAGADSFTYAASDGSAQSGPATATIFVSPTECAPRPRVQAAPTAGGGKLQVHIESTPLNTHAPNPLRVLRFGTFQNARVTLNGQPIASGQTFAVPSSSAVDFTVERVTPGQATTVPLTIVDGCGEWPTFVGGGPEAGF